MLYLSHKGAIIAAFAALVLNQAAPTANARTLDAVHVSVGETTRAPAGWAQFCRDNPGECGKGSTEPRDVVLTPEAWRDLQRVNRWVNETIEPLTDQDQWGVVEHWSYPDTGKGDCEDYALLKRRMLIEAGWPREALLMTVAIDEEGGGHAVLTVKTDRGDFILDNVHDDILLWSKTKLQFVRRQSQSNPDVWVGLSDPRPVVATARARR